MDKFHLLAGLPRSGSTLLCQILNINPSFRATSTSPMIDMLTAQQTVFSHNPGFKSVDRMEFYGPFADAQEAFLKAFYKTAYPKAKVVFDKNRGWPQNLMKLDEIFDNSDTKIIWTYRPPIEIVASMEKQHREYPLIQYVDEQQQPGALGTMDARIQHWISDGGIITMPMSALQEAISNGYESRIKIIDYKSLCIKTQETMDSIHEFLEIDTFNYSEKEFKNLKQTTFEYDNLYNYKYPHNIKEGLIEYSEHDVEYLQAYRKILEDRYAWMIKHCGDTLIKDANKRLSRKDRMKANRKSNNQPVHTK